MKITSLSAQIRNPDRINLSIDGKFKFSLDISQVIDLGIRVGREIEDAELIELETASQFGKLYGRALEYSLMRPHSVREVKDYLYRKTLTTKYKTRQGQLKDRAGFSSEIASQVLDKLQAKGYVDDEKFARWWVDSRHQTKGISRRKLSAELTAKGVSRQIVDQILADSSRDDLTEIQKIISKKQSKYNDRQKLIAYLARQGFKYDDIIGALNIQADQS